MKGTLLERIPPGVVTWIVPVVAPAGTLAVISPGATTGESCGRAVEGDCCSFGQIHSQDDDFCANAAGRGQRSDERRRSDIEFENGAVILGATFAGRL